MPRTGQPKKYNYQVGDIVDDYECIDIQKDEQNRTKYIMKCKYCGKEKAMLGSTIGYHQGTHHKSCGKGLGITYDRDFYQRWQSMRARTSPNFWCHEEYYDRGINSDAFASFIDFFNAMYPSWLEHKKRFGAADTSLERIDVNKSYTPENCTWICFDEQKGNLQKTIYFTITYEDGTIEYAKNARKWAFLKGLPENYINEIINKNKTYKKMTFKRITKEEYAQHNLDQYEKCNDYRKDIQEEKS